MTKRRWIDDIMQNKQWIVIRREPQGQQDRRNPANEPFWRKQENAAKHETGLRVWRATE